jgi:hypothetical protein
MADATVTAMEPQLRSRLVQMPLEILLRITYFVSTTDLGNVRLSCKALEQALFAFFSHEFFRKKQFMVTSDSLQALVDISKHPTLSPTLEHVIIGADRLGRSPGSGLSGPDYTKYEENAAQLRLATADHENLLITGGLRHMLAEAFANLANLKTVDIRDFNATSRSRDGLGTPWRSYGSARLEALGAVGSTMHGPRAFQDPYITQLFSAVIAALAVAQARPQSIEVLIRSGRHQHAWGLHDNAFYILPHMEESTAALLSGLQSLHLSLVVVNTFRPFMYQKFLSLASNLTWLRLNCKGSQDEGRSIFSWLALRETEKPPKSFDLDPIQFQRLERLDIGQATIEASLLLKLAAKFSPSLRRLYLRTVTLWDSEGHLLRKVTPWTGFLSALSRLPDLKLRELSLSGIMHACSTHINGRFFCGHVMFYPNEAGPANGWMCSTGLTTLDKAVAQAIAAMIPEFPLDGMYACMSVKIALTDCLH